MDLRPLFFAALALALISGCTRDDVIVDPGPEPRLGEPLALDITGPWASPDTSVEIRPGGDATVRQSRGENTKPIAYELSPRELRALDDAAELSFDDGGRRFPFRCLDCFVYEIRYGEQRIVLDQAALDASLGAKRLVGLIERGLPAELAR